MDRTRPATLALLGLAASALVLSPEPPRDRLFAAAAAFLGARPGLASALLEGAFAVSIGAGAATLVVLALVKLLDIFGTKGSKAAGRPRRRSWAAIFAAYALFVIAFAIARRGAGSSEGGGIVETAMPAGAGGAASAAIGPTDGPVHSAPVVLPFLPLAAAGALAAGGIVLASLHSRRGRRAVSPPLEPGEDDEGFDDTDAVTAIAESRRRLELGGPAREAIVACYAEMCAIFAGPGPRLGAGIERGGMSATRSLTAREFAALLRSKGASEPEIAALTSIFEKARYSNEDCVEDDRLSAVRALGALELRYGRGNA